MFIFSQKLVLLIVNTEQYTNSCIRIRFKVLPKHAFLLFSRLHCKKNILWLDRTKYIINIAVPPVVHVAVIVALCSIITKLHIAALLLFPFQQNVTILNFTIEQPLNVVIISKYFTYIFTTTKRKQLATMLLYFLKKIFLKHPISSRVSRVGGVSMVSRVSRVRVTAYCYH